MLGISKSSGSQELIDLLEFLKDADLYEKRLNEIMEAEKNAQETLDKYGQVERIEELLKQAQIEQDGAARVKRNALTEANKIIEAAKGEVLLIEQSIKDKKSGLAMLESQAVGVKAERDAVRVEVRNSKIKAGEIIEDAAAIRDSANAMKDEVAEKLKKLNSALESIG